MPARLTRLAWFLTLALTAWLFVGALPWRLGRLAALSPEGVPVGWTTGAWGSVLSQHGLSTDFYASYQVAFEILLAGGFALAAMLVARRGPERVTLLAAVALLLSGLALLPVLAALPASLHELVRALRAVAWFTLVALLLIFPDGRFTPRWTLWLLAGWGAFQLAAMVVPVLAPPLALRALDTRPEALAAAWHAAWLALGALFQYRRVVRTTNVAHRQQSKWLLLGLATALAGSALWLLPQWLLPLDHAPGLLGLVYTLLSVPAHVLLLLAWPAALALAATRTALWEVDFLLNRALVYGPLLAGLLVLSAALLYALERLLPGEPVLTFALTAVLAGLLFRPLRYRLQRWVDRRLFGIGIDYRARPGPGGGLELPASHLGPYSRLQLIGASEFGHAYRALAPSQTGAVTLHVLPAALSANPALAGHFKAELAAAARLEHPNLARVYAAGEADGRLYAATEFLVGQELSSFLLINGRLGLARARPILADLAQALDYLHAQDQVHGDVRLRNVMLVLREPGQLPRDARFPARVAFLPTEAFRTVLLHIGLARALHSGRRGAALPYTAPELIRNAPSDGRADVYSLGVLAYQLLAGMLPFPQVTPGALVIAHLRQAPPDPRSRVSSLSPAVALALMRAIAKDPQDRFSSAGAFIDALE